MSCIEDRFEYTTEQDKFFDFCLWEYTPVIPYENKFRSINLLFKTFDIANTDDRAFDIVQAIQKGVGVSNTVWGVKQTGEKISWEFYFYDYERNKRERSISKLLEAIMPFTPCSLKANENHHYFMFSIDLDNGLMAGTRGLDEVHMYIGNPGSSVSSGICYSLTSTGTRLENFYFFFDAENEMEDILAKTVCSAHFDSEKTDINEILWPEIKECKVIVVANKQNNDALYFSGINIYQLIFFLKKMTYPDKIISFVETNRSSLDHLQYDVGFDYRVEGGKLRILKSGYYGIF